MSTDFYPFIEKEVLEARYEYNKHIVDDFKELKKKSSGRCRRKTGDSAEHICKARLNRFDFDVYILGSENNLLDLMIDVEGHLPMRAQCKSILETNAESFLLSLANESGKWYVPKYGIELLIGYDISLDLMFAKSTYEIPFRDNKKMDKKSSTIRYIPPKDRLLNTDPVGLYTDLNASIKKALWHRQLAIASPISGPASIRLQAKETRQKILLNFLKRQTRCGLSKKKD